MNVNWTMVTVKRFVITPLGVLSVIVEQASLCNQMGARVEVRHMRNKSRILPLNSNAFTIVCNS